MQGDGYRYGFNGMEKDDEVKGTGNSYDFGARMYDSRVGRWLSTDPLAHKYPTMSPFVFCANNPIIYVDPDGRDIIYAGTEAQQAAAKKLVADAGKDTKMKTIIDKLTASDVKFYILIGTQSEVFIHTGDPDVDRGGVTTYKFYGDEGVTIGIENVNTPAAEQIGAIADELKTGEQFLDGKLGFELYSDGTTGPLAYDPTDELETKIAGSDALTANGYSSKDLVQGKASTTIVSEYEKMNKETDGSLNKENLSKLQDVMWATAYKDNFSKKTKKDASVDADKVQGQKGSTTVRREDNKTVKEKL
jgi:RHS repeat-associated protein